MAKKPLKLPPVPKHNKLTRLIRRSEDGDAAVRGRFQDAWEESRRRNQASQRGKSARPDGN